jgi:hypothetical protein
MSNTPNPPRTASPAPAATRPQISQLQRSAQAIGRAIAGELGKLPPAERRELLRQMREWLGLRLAAFDAGGAAPPEAAERRELLTQMRESGGFGKGSRTADAIREMSVE